MYLLRYAALTHPGRVRENNEDNYYVNGSWRRESDPDGTGCEGESRDGFLLAGVCDGMGGQEMGEVASLTAVETMYERYLQGSGSRALEETAGQSRLPEHVQAYVEEANRRLCQRMQLEGKRLGTTLSILEFSKDAVMAVNLGDSRMYRLRKGRLEQLSIDHTVVARMLRQGQLTEKEAKAHPMRHRITQYLGIFPEEMVLEPAVTPRLPLAEGDCYLICSDGLTDMVEEQTIQSILAREASPEEQAEDLVRTALQAGGRDNVTVVVVQVKTASERPYLQEIRDTILEKCRQLLRAGNQENTCGENYGISDRNKST